MYWTSSSGMSCWKAIVLYALNPGKENTSSSPCSRESTGNDDGILSLSVLPRKMANRPWQHVLQLTHCFLTTRTLKSIQPQAIRIKLGSFLILRKGRSSVATDYGPW